MARQLIASDELSTKKGIKLGDRQRKRLEDQKRFPKRVPTSARSYGYIEAEIDAYVEQCIAERDTEKTPAA